MIYTPDAALAAAAATEPSTASTVVLPSPRLATDPRLVQDTGGGQLAASVIVFRVPGRR
jgi:hypothetical protein